MAESSFQFETLLNGRYPSAVLHLGVGYSLDFKTLSFRSDVFAKGPRSRFFKSTFSVVFRINWRTGSTLEFETLSSIGRFCVGACKRFAVLHWRVVYSLEFGNSLFSTGRICREGVRSFVKSNPLLYLGVNYSDESSLEFKNLSPIGPFCEGVMRAFS